MKKIIFVSTGRCGTKRIYQILKDSVPENICVVHQMRYSRFANILGSIMVSSNGRINLSFFYNFLIKKYIDANIAFISTDPLSSIILSDDIIISPKTCIIHLERDDDSFAESMTYISKNRFPSFIAHNFVPFWQPGLYPLENLFNKNCLAKYAKINAIKNKYFAERYSVNQFYKRLNYKEIFTTNILENIVNKFLNLEVTIPDSALNTKSNESRHT